MFRGAIIGKLQLSMPKFLPSFRQCGWEPNIYADHFEAKYEAYFNKPDIDGWEIRRHMNNMLHMDLVPEPKIIAAALKACRRVNDHALAVRWLEGCRQKCGNKRKTIYPWLIQEIRPTLDELGISTPEEMGYDCPELALQNVNEMDGSVKK